MLRLHQTFGAHAGRVREIDQEVVRFGRLPTNDFVFDAHADLDASGNHAELRREAGKWVLVDVGSRNGTLVNGRPIQRCVLEGNEEVEFGTGGPRVRIEIVMSGRGVPTAPATPISSLDPNPGFISPQGPTAYAPIMKAPSVRPQPPIPPNQIPTPVWPVNAAPPFAPPPAMQPSPAPMQPLASYSPLAEPTGPGSGSPKLYGVRTVEQMIQSAVSQAQSSQIAPVNQPPVPSGKAHDTAYIRQVAEDAAGKRSRGVVFVLGIVLAMFALTLCGVSGIIALLWVQSTGGL